MSEHKQHFSIRKLSIGAASVLIGMSFMTTNSNKVHADVNNDNKQSDKNDAASLKQVQTQKQVEQTQLKVKTPAPQSKVAGVKPNEIGGSVARYINVVLPDDLSDEERASVVSELENSGYQKVAPNASNLYSNNTWELAQKPTFSNHKSFWQDGKEVVIDPGENMHYDIVAIPQINGYRSISSMDASVTTSISGKDVTYARAISIPHLYYIHYQKNKKKTGIPLTMDLPKYDLNKLKKSETGIPLTMDLPKFDLTQIQNHIPDVPDTPVPQPDSTPNTNNDIPSPQPLNQNTPTDPEIETVAPHANETPDSNEWVETTPAPKVKASTLIASSSHKKAAAKTVAPKAQTPDELPQTGSKQAAAIIALAGVGLTGLASFAVIGGSKKKFNK